ncbi:Acetoin utilization protein AcuC [Rubripirellula obstinata]|uniref:Acetoin utilization protein AcuC n=1 Tax=Rubripirellula obstinata TaxID=406547 RepID=A0A5B1CD94_9BACT|nr:histone deacetylase [Rubripirellula obstinata]KAA1257709.1 Acetoin utilization protein AcuC [Rubripirellula obstinata]
MKIYYTDHFELPLPDGHRFPMSKYRLLRKAVVESDRLRGDVLVVPKAATDEDLLRCHSPRYVAAVSQGKLSAAEVRRIGFPWSPKMVQRSRRSTGATMAASLAALADGVSVNLAGGTHHAMKDAGEGYCVFNDAAVAIRSLQTAGTIQRACVIDLDVHQGNGTAEIFQDDASVFTLSIHGEKNFPSRKTASDLDVALPDGTDDAGYLSALSDSLTKVSEAGPIDLAIFLAGADPYLGDRLGRLKLTMEGLKRRDQAVFQWCQQNQTPVAVAMAGGYAENVAEIVQIHAATVDLASQFARKRQAK